MGFTSRRSWFLVGLSSLLAGALAACSSGGSTDSSASASGSPAASVSVPASASVPASVSAPPSSASESTPPAGPPPPPGMPAPASNPPAGPVPSGPAAGAPAPMSACAWQTGSPSVIATPCAGLTNGQTITIRGRGFAPSKPVLAVQCLDNASGPSACNLAPNLSLTNLPQTWDPNSDGTVTINLKVVQQFNGHTCSAATPCVVSIASIDQSEQPSAPISFRQ